MDSYCSINTGVTPHESASLRQVRSLVVSPRMSTGERKRETIRAVIPDSEQTAMTLAFMSMASPQVACDRASTVFLILNSASAKRAA